MLAAADYDSRDLARLEWGLLPHVSRHERLPGALNEILAEDAVKDAGVGGAVEREFAREYEGYAIAARPTHPRTARMLRGIAESYRRGADREDDRADDD